jgi:nitroreductase
MMSKIDHPIHISGLAARQSNHPVDPLFIGRWSPRAFTGDAIVDADLFTAFEAARWAPSSLNAQPWRFVFARRGHARFDDFLDLLAERNRQWAHKAGALVFFLSDTELAYKDRVAPSPSHAFDTGAAWANFAHQLHLLGYATRAIGGFDRARAPQVLGAPDAFHVHAVVAVGRPAAAHTLPDTFREKETPSSRKPLSELVFEGVFGSAG